MSGRHQLLCEKVNAFEQLRRTYEKETGRLYQVRYKTKRSNGISIFVLGVIIGLMVVSACLYFEPIAKFIGVPRATFFRWGVVATVIVAVIMSFDQLTAASVDIMDGIKITTIRRPCERWLSELGSATEVLSAVLENEQMKARNTYCKTYGNQFGPIVQELEKEYDCEVGLATDLGAKDESHRQFIGVKYPEWSILSKVQARYYFTPESYASLTDALDCMRLLKEKHRPPS